MLTSVFVLLSINATLRQKVIFSVFWILLASIILIIVFGGHRKREKVQHPSHVMDVALAIKFMKEKGGEYFNGDPHKIILLGHSAGSAICSLLCTNPEYLAKVNLSPLDIRACICLSGVYNDNNFRQTVIQRAILHETFGFNREDHINAFAIHHMHPECSPPFLLINAGKDSFLKRHAHEFYLTLKAAKVYVEAVLIKGTDHFNIIFNWNRGHKNYRVLEIILDFLQRSI